LRYSPNGVMTGSICAIRLTEWWPDLFALFA